MRSIVAVGATGVLLVLVAALCFINGESRGKHEIRHARGALKTRRDFSEPTRLRYEAQKYVSLTSDVFFDDFSDCEVIIRDSLSVTPDSRDSDMLLHHRQPY